VKSPKNCKFHDSEDIVKVEDDAQRLKSSDNVGMNQLLRYGVSCLTRTHSIEQLQLWWLRHQGWELQEFPD
jgi:hypothetical protein